MEKHNFKYIGLKIVVFFLLLISFSCATPQIEVNLPEVVKNVEEKLEGEDLPIKVAIMGCVVNAIGEAREADIGLACGNKSAILFKKGQPLKRVSEEEMVDQLLEEIQKMKEEENGRA